MLNFTKQLLVLSFKNLKRNIRRSLLVASGIIIGSIALFVFGGYINAINYLWGDELIHSEYGHIQVFRKDYLNFDSNDQTKMVEKSNIEAIKKLLKDNMDLKVITERSYFGGFIGNGESSVLFIGRTQNESNERILRNKTPKLAEGKYLNGKDQSGIVIAQGLAKKLNAKVGDEMILLTNSVDGSTEAINVKIRGIAYFKDKFLNNKYIVANDTYIKDNLLYTKNSHRLLILLNDDTKIDSTLLQLNQFIQDNKLDIEANNWRDVATYFIDVLKMFNSFFMILTTILAIVIIFSVSNSIYMSTTERMREFSTLKAIGIQDKIISIVLFIEGFILSIISFVISFAIVLYLEQYINSSNFYLPPFPGQVEKTQLVIYIDFILTLKIIFFILITTFLANLFPILKVQKTPIVKGLKYV